MSASTKQIVETSLMLGGAALGATGAVLIEPVVIGAGVLVAGYAAYMRYNDQRNEASKQVESPKAAAATK